MFASGATHLHVMPRAIALAVGAKSYGTGLPCVHGHVEWRTTSDGQCHGCAREKTRAARSARRDEAQVAREKLVSDAALQFSGRELADGQLVQRSVAMRIGLKTYFTGDLCIHGHLSDRYVRSGLCCACGLQHGRSRYARNRASDREKHREWRKKNPGYRRAYKAANREMYRAIYARTGAKRRALKAGGSSTAEIRAWLKTQPKICHWCGVRCDENHHVDHYEPLARGGRHEIANLVISCPPCNLRKHAKDPYDFAASLGRLF